MASLEDFVLTACANELGLEVPGHHQAASPLAPDAKARGLDLTAEECDALVAYVRSLPPPVSLDPSDAQAAAAVAEGRRLFHSVGCASCHTADLGSIRGIYSDLLLHDMGEELSDSGAYYATESTRSAPRRSREWRTPPLWGFRDSAPYLHDGRARNLEQAVALHHGQGAASASPVPVDVRAGAVPGGNVPELAGRAGRGRRAPSRRGSGSPSRRTNPAPTPPRHRAMGRTGGTPCSGGARSPCGVGPTTPKQSTSPCGCCRMGCEGRYTGRLLERGSRINGSCKPFEPHPNRPVSPPVPKNGRLFGRLRCDELNQTECRTQVFATLTFRPN